jgi:hypothetical protein
MPWIRWTLLSAFFILAASVALATQSADSIVLRTSVTPEQPWIGQRVLFRIDVLGENGWAQLSRIGNFDVPGAYVFRTESQGIRLQERINGIAYTGQRYEMSIYPQKSDLIKIPAIPVEVAVKTWGVNAKETAHQAKTSAITFRCRIPPGADRKRGIISTDRLTAVQKWEPDTGELNVGETILRILQMSAVDVPAMAFTPINFIRPENVDLYTQTPITGDQYNRGALTGKRTETVTYLFKKAGTVELPAVQIIWWDLKNRTLQETRLPSRAIEIKPAMIAGSGATVDAPSHKKSWAVEGTLLAVIILLIWLFYRRLRKFWVAMRQARSVSEKACFKNFIKAARTDNPAIALNALMQWLDRIHANTQIAQLNRFLELYADPQVASEADQMIRAIDPTSRPAWNRGRIAEGVSLARRKWIRAQRRKKDPDRQLPLLNP